MAYTARGFGYKANDDEGIIFLQTVSLCFATAEELRRFASFALECATNFEQNPEWDHQHFYPNGPEYTTFVLGSMDSETAQLPLNDGNL